MITQLHGVLLLLFLLPSISFAAFDTDQLAREQGLKPLLRWDNIEGSPHWMGGQKPQKIHWRGEHSIQLAPGQYSRLRLNQGEMLRLVKTDGSVLKVQDIELNLSNGSGLAQVIKPQIDARKGQLIFAPHADQDRIVHLVRPTNTAESIDLKVYLSRQDDWHHIAPYRQLIPLPHAPVQLQRDKEAVADSFWPQDNNITQVSIHGPGRLLIEQRYRYEANDSRTGQRYQLHTRLDDGPWHVQYEQTGPESQHPLRVNGQAAVLGKLEQHYLTIPTGRHQLSLRSSSPLFIRLRQQQEPAYFLPDLNALPAPSSDEQQALASHNERINAVRQQAWELIKNKHLRGGGLLGPALLKQAAAQHPQRQALAQEADQLAATHSAYRELLPQTLADDQTTQLRWFSTPRLIRSSQQGRARIMAAQHANSAAAGLSSARFYPLSSTTTYWLPERHAPSQLRLLIDRADIQTAHTLWLQFDQQDAVKLSANTAWFAQDQAWLAGRAESGLLIQSQAHQQSNTPSLDGAFAQRDLSAPMIDVASLVLELPTGVKQLRLWSDNHHAPAPHLALQYRAANPYSLSENEYLSLWQHHKTADQDFKRIQRLLNQPITELNEIDAALANHWLPLRRQLQRQQQKFSDTLSASTQPPRLAHNPSQAKILSAQARTAEASHDWVGALSHWRKAAQISRGQTRINAALNQVRILQQLNEHFLAQQLLKGVYLFDTDETLRQSAYKKLLNIYQDDQNINAMQALLAHALSQKITSENLSLYVQNLLSRGKTEQALWLSLAQSTEHSAEQLLAASYQRAWWQLFDQTLNQASPTSTNLWQGYRAQAQGRYDAARKHWQAAGDAGQRLIKHLNQGLDIRAALAQTNKRQALTAWSVWQQQHPGPWQWRKESKYIHGAAGSAVLYAIEQDIHSQAYRGNQHQPIKLRIAGPALLQFKVRPIHPSPDSSFNGWLQVRDGGQVSHLPFFNNKPAAGLQWLGEVKRVAGQNEVIEYQVASGLHELELSLGELEFLATAEVYRPQLPLAVLPTLTPDTLIALNQPQAPDLAVNCQAYDRQAILLRCDRHQTARQSSITPEQPSITDWPFPAHVALHPSDPRRTPIRLNHDKINHHSSAYEQVIHWLWLAEQQPKRLFEAAIAVEKLLIEKPQDTDLARLAKPLSQQLRWRSINSVSNSAGLRYQHTNGWQPESRAGKVRRALLGLDDPTLHIVREGAALGLALNNVRKTQLKLSLALAPLPFSLTPETRVTFRLDNDTARSITLNANGRSQEFSIDIPAGRHTLRFELPEATNGQRVTIQLWERPAGSSTAHYKPILRNNQRPYHIATQDESILLQLQGPTIVRNNELVGDTVIQHFYPLPAGWHTLTFSPKQGQQQAQFRFHHRSLVDDQTNVPPIISAQDIRPIIPLPWATAPISLAAQPNWPNINDSLPLGGQEDGTWSVGARLSDRRQVEEDGTSQTAEQFLMLHADHRHYDAERNSYYQGRLLSRVRQEGGMTLGAIGRWQHQPRWHRWQLGMNASVYVQNPNNTANEWAAALRADLSQSRKIDFKTRHRPSIQLFLRWLSLDGFESYSRPELDQDIFSPYKASHRQGLKLSDRLSHRPWLDTEWYGKVALQSNENLNPLSYDHISLQAGWQQLVGNFQLDGEVGIRSYRADQDRSTALTRKHLQLNIDWDHWLAQERRWQVQFQIRHDVDVDDTSFWLGLIWHGGNGRGLRDFRAGEESFQNLRHQNMAQRTNPPQSEGSVHE